MVALRTELERAAAGNAHKEIASKYIMGEVGL
jgi:hypothetical protein